MKFNDTVKKFLEGHNVPPKPGRSISTTGRSLGQGTTSAILPGEDNTKIDSISPGGMLPSPKELSLVKRVERRAKQIQNKKPVYKPSRNKAFNLPRERKPNI